MAEINEITVFKDSSGNPSYGLVDDQHRVVVTLEGGTGGIFLSGEATDITAGADNDVVSYTVPAGKVLTISGWESSGPAHATFKFVKDSSIVSQKRNSVAEPNVGTMIKNGLEMPAGTVVKIVVNHHQSGKQASFFGTLYGTERDA